MKLLSFPLSEKVYSIPFLLLKDNFSGYRILHWWAFSFQHLKYFTSLACMLSDKNPVHSYPCTSIDIFFPSRFFQDFPFVFFLCFFFCTYWFLCCFGGIYQEVCVYVYFIFLDTLWASWIYSLLSVTIFGTFWLLLLEIFPCSLSTFQCFNNVSVLPLDITSHFLDELFCFCFHAFFPPLCISV